MFERILVPLDLTGSHGSVLDVAARLAREGAGKLTLVHVVRIIPGLLVEDERAFYASLDRKTRAHLSGLASEVASHGVTCTVEVRYGDPAREIVRLCDEIRADLVVLASHRVDGPGSAGWGTLSYKIGVLSPCPVLLVK